MSAPLDLAALAAQVRPPDETVAAQARERQDRLTKPAGALGRLEPLSVWLAATTGRCPPQPPQRARVVVFAGDHGVARTAATSAYPPEVTAQMVHNLVGGGAAVTVMAAALGAGVRVLDLAVDADDDAALPDEVRHWKVRRGSGSIDREDAMSAAESDAALRAGLAIADDEIDAGADLLIPGDMGIGNTTVAATLVGLLTGAGPLEVVGRGTGIDDLTWMRKCAAVRDAMRRGRPHTADPAALLAAVGGADVAAMSGFLLQAAVRRTPVILDGVVSGAAALVAARLCPTAALWWQAGHRSTEPAHRLALDALALSPLLDLDLRLGEGTGGLLALPLVQAAAATLRDMATFDEAGVSGPAAAPPPG